MGGRSNHQQSGLLNDNQMIKQTLEYYQSILNLQPTIDYTNTKVLTSLILNNFPLYLSLEYLTTLDTGLHNNPTQGFL